MTAVFVVALIAITGLAGFCLWLCHRTNIIAQARVDLATQSTMKNTQELWGKFNEAQKTAKEQETAYVQWLVHLLSILVRMSEDERGRLKVEIEQLFSKIALDLGSVFEGAMHKATIVLDKKAAGKKS